MFERYTEKARRVIFFARYEASQFGSPYIETEHLLLGLLREDKALANRFLRSHAAVESIRKQIEGHTTIREKVSTSVDLPLSHECKRVLAYGAEEAERLNHKHIGTEHLLLGLLREEKCFAAEILHERGLRLSTIREELAAFAIREGGLQPPQGKLAAGRVQPRPHAGRHGQLARSAHRPRLRALERVVQILCRRTKNNPVLIGEPGVGKTAIVEGLAQRIAEGDVPSFLADKRILALDLSLIVAGTKYRGQFEERLKTIMKELMENQNAIIFIDELHTLVGAGSAEGSLDAANILKPALSRGEIQCIGATTPSEFRKSIEKDRSLERRFQAVKVPPPSERMPSRSCSASRTATRNSTRWLYRRSHRTAVFTSSRYIPDRFLPDKAIDLIDEAGARVKLRQTTLPSDLADIQKRIKFIVHRMENAIANHEFEKARFYSDEERKERENMRQLREKYNLDDSSTGIVTKDDIEDVVARWTGVPMTAIKEEEITKLLRIEEELHKRIISQEKAISALARAIRRSRAGLKATSRPAGSFLFLGPTGVGKTEVARALASSCSAAKNR
jgi:ATP-dependent Clp protease ATP-binding subunit ClpC